MSLLTDPNSPPPAALRSEPMTLAEIDAHPDSARIWATIIAMRAEVESLTDEAEERGHRRGLRDAT